MTTPYALVESPLPADRPIVRPAEPSSALHRGAMFLRVMSGLLLLVMVLHVGNVMSGVIEMSYGVLFGEAIRLVVFAAVLWGVADFAELSMTAQRDLRAIRLLLEKRAEHPRR